jgi:hypothetical protein
MTGRTRARCSTISGIGTSSTRCDTRSWSIDSNWLSRKWLQPRSEPAERWYTLTVPKRTLYGTVMRSRTRKNKGKKSKRRRAPIAANGTVPPRRVTNLKRRPREYLTVKSRAADGGRAQARTPWGSRCDNDPRCVPPRTSTVGGVHVAVGHDRFGARARACATSKKRNAVRATAWRFRVAGTAEAQARRNRKPLRVHDRTSGADHDCRISQDDYADRGRLRPILSAAA